MATIEQARKAAAAYLDDKGYPAEARLVRDGKGDDFAEVRIAFQILALDDREGARYRRALETYADPEFWAGGNLDIAAAADDLGQIARTELGEGGRA